MNKQSSSHSLRPAPPADEHHIFYLVRRLRTAAFDHGTVHKGSEATYQRYRLEVDRAYEALRKEIEMQFRDAIERL
jgi:hypothetical protein